MSRTLQLIHVHFGLALERTGCADKASRIAAQMVDAPVAEVRAALGVQHG